MNRWTSSLVALSLAFAGLGCRAKQPTSQPESPQAAEAATQAALEQSLVAKATQGVADTPVPLPTSVTPNPLQIYPIDVYVLLFHPTNPNRMWLSIGTRVVTVDIDANGARPVTAKEIKFPEGQYAFAMAYPKGGDFFIGGSHLLRRSKDDGVNWEDVAALKGEDIAGLVADPTDSRTLYAFVRGKGVYKSIDNAETWKPGGALPEKAFGLWMVQADPLRLMTYNHDSESVLTSDDGGSTWEQTAPIGLEKRPYQVAVGGKTAYAATAAGILTSSDGGKTWTSVGGPKPPNLFSVALPPEADQTLVVVGLNANFYRSVDGGKTW